MSEERFDVVVVGAGVLGIAVSFWLTELLECRVALLEKESSAALHTTSRNTGLVHRPFYLDPERKRLFARTAACSYSIWEKIASRFNLPWSRLGTLEVARTEEEVRTLERYIDWGLENGMEEGELELLGGADVRRIENEVVCVAALNSKRDVSTNFALLAGAMLGLARGRGVRPGFGGRVVGAEEKRGATLIQLSDGRRFISRLMINTAGGSALELAHSMGYAERYSELHFRGDYWVVEAGFGRRVSRNVYSVPLRGEFPFLDPHFVVRADGRREVGPNAALVSGPEAYTGIDPAGVVKNIFRRPVAPKARLFARPSFLGLVSDEWASSLSKAHMCSRVRSFIPGLRAGMLTSRGQSGVRSLLLDRSGFVPEALLIEGENSVHVLNYNSPGATGAPAFGWYIVSTLVEKGLLDGIPKRRGTGTQGFDELSGCMEDIKSSRPVQL